MNKKIESLVLWLAPLAKRFGLTTTDECWREYQRALRMKEPPAAARRPERDAPGGNPLK